MKRSFILVGLLLVFGMVAELSAQEKKVVILYRQETMDLLGLDQQQQKKVMALAKQSARDLKALKEDTSLSEREQKTKRAAIYKNREAEFKKVLTEEQWGKLIEMREAAKKENAQNGL